jgi:hypothetical protein
MHDTLTSGKLHENNCENTKKNNEILRKTETDKWVQPVGALPGGSLTLTYTGN